MKDGTDLTPRAAALEWLETLCPPAASPDTATASQYPREADADLEAELKVPKLVSLHSLEQLYRDLATERDLAAANAAEADAARRVLASARKESSYLVDQQVALQDELVGRSARLQEEMAACIRESEERALAAEARVVELQTQVDSLRKQAGADESQIGS